MTVAKIKTKQKMPASAEKIKRVSMTKRPTERGKHHYEDTQAPCQSSLFFRAGVIDSTGGVKIEACWWS